MILLLGGAFIFACLLSSCSPARPPGPAPVDRWELFAAPRLAQWKEAAMSASGGITTEVDGLTLKEGTPMTGAIYPDWLKEGLPVTDYAIEYQAQRVAGQDFFGSVTFPVRDAETYVTFVLGGWGGSQVGISSIDGYDASENTTGSSQKLENGMWYHVRIEVRTGELRVLLNGRPIVQTNLKGRTLGLRGGEIDRCMPFGFASYRATGRVRGCVVERLK